MSMAARSGYFPLLRLQDPFVIFPDTESSDPAKDFESGTGVPPVFSVSSVTGGTPVPLCATLPPSASASFSTS